MTTVHCKVPLSAHLLGFGLRIQAKETDMTKHDQEQQDQARAAANAQNVPEQERIQGRQDVDGEAARAQARQQAGKDNGPAAFRPQGTDAQHTNFTGLPSGSVPRAGGKLAPLPGSAVRDALAAGVDCNGQLDALANSHGASVVRAAVEALRGDPNYGTNAAGWLAKP